MALALKFQNKSYNIDIGEADMSLSDLSVLIAEVTGSRSSVIKLLVPGRKAVHLSAEGSTSTRLRDAGLVPGTHALMLATSQESVQQVQAAKEQPRLPGFDHELRLAAARRGRGRGDAASSSHAPPDRRAFAEYSAWELPSLSPKPQDALKLLHRLAADPGIVHVMQQHQWTVGLLSELPPEGKVGVSPVCVLGLNVNRGQEIRLRLRTDDLKGFRKYDKIRDTLVHELAHMVHDEHDNAFKALNSELRRQVLGVSLAAGPAFHLGPVSGAADDMLGTSHWAMMGDEVGGGAGGRTGGWEGGEVARGRTLAAGPAQAHSVPARMAAAEAALRRSQAAAAGGSEDGAGGAAGAAGAAGAESPARDHRDGGQEAGGSGDEEWRRFEHQDEGTRQAEEAMLRLEQE